MIRYIGEMDDLHRFQFTQKLIHLFLPVAGCFSDYDVREISIGAALFQSMSIAGFDQGA